MLEPLTVPGVNSSGKRKVFLLEFNGEENDLKNYLYRITFQARLKFKATQGLIHLISPGFRLSRKSGCFIEVEIRSPF